MGEQSPCTAAEREFLEASYALEGGDDFTRTDGTTRDEELRAAKSAQHASPPVAACIAVAEAIRTLDAARAGAKR